MQFLGTETPQGTSWTSPTLLANTADLATGSVFSDQSGTLLIRQSGNGTNWDISDSYTVVANTGLKLNSAILNPYVDVTWASGSSPTIFRVFVRLASEGATP